MGRPYVIEYRHNGRTYHLEMEADSHANAMERLRDAYHNGEALERVGTAPVPGFIGRMIGG